MEHSEATETMASARYLLSEMTDEERDGVEEHFFGCSECARDVREGSAMIDSIRAGRPASGRVAPARTLPWILAAAAAAASFFFGLQNAQLKRDVQPRVLPSYSMLAMGSRGASETVINDPAQPFALYVDIPPRPPQTSYRIEIRNAANEAKVSLPVTAAQARETVSVYVPPHRLQSGHYTVVVIGGDSSAITSAALNVR